jgi:dienelactone hydrolase
MSERKRTRRARATLAALGLAAVLGTGAVLYLLRDPAPRFAERRSRLVEAVEETTPAGDGYTARLVRLRAASGLEVALAVKEPAPSAADAAEARRPLVVLLGGTRTGRDAVNLIPETRGAIVAALSYPYPGDTRLKGLAIPGKVPAIRGAVLDTPPAVMLALDYLLARPDVDSARVELVGVSFGAPFVVIAGALDQRVSRVWCIHGSGESYAPLELNVRRKIPFPASTVVAGLANVAIAGPRLAPERWVGSLAPRPFIMVNATDDERLPRSSVDVLFRAAGEPKELVWVPGHHVRSEAAFVRPLVDLVLDRVSPRIARAEPADYSARPHAAARPAAAHRAGGP